MKKLLLIATLVVCLTDSFAQVRTNTPATKTTPVLITTTSKTDTLPQQRPKDNGSRLTALKVTSANNNVRKPITSPGLITSVLQPNLKWVDSYPSDVDNKNIPWVTKYYTGEKKYITGKAETPQWQSDFIWYGIPPNATSARFEISSLPFPMGEEKDFKGVIETRTILKSKPDTVKFFISFKQKMEEKRIESREKKPALYQKEPVVKYSYSGILAFDAIKTYGTYYVRLTPLDAKGSPIIQGGNVIKIVPDYINFPPPPVPTSEDSLASDYEITAVNYMPMHYPEPAYVNCIVVTGYNEPEIKENQNSFIGPMGISWQKEQVSLFKAAFPVGTIICPSPPKEKSWYEKAFNSVTDAAAWAVNGASKVYGDTKTYLKGKFSEYMCNYDPVVSSNKKLLEQSGMSKKQIDDGCNLATGIAFEVAMSYAGMPPSIPNFDEMAKLAKGQLVQILIQKAAEQTGMPCDETCAELVAKGLDKMIEESAKKNTQNGGFFNYKPDPRGQYRLPYVEIEITRKRNTQKSGPLFTNLYFTPQVEKIFSEKDINGNISTTQVSSTDLYEKIQLPVPYLKRTGDKIKLIAVLTPKFAYIKTDCTTKKITGVTAQQHLCLGWNTLEQPGEDPKNSSGYSMMLENASITINPVGKIKLEKGVGIKFPHHY